MNGVIDIRGTSTDAYLIQALSWSSIRFPCEIRVHLMWTPCLSHVRVDEESSVASVLFLTYQQRESNWVPVLGLLVLSVLRCC
jgi:hypothetical protein